MTKIIHRNQSSKSAALGLLRAGFRPHLAQAQRRYKAEYRRILRGGEPPAGLDRDYALAWLHALIGGYRDTLQRIALVASRADSAVGDVGRILDGRSEIALRPRSTAGPPRTQRRPAEGNSGALRTTEVAGCLIRTPPAYTTIRRPANKNLRRRAWLRRFACAWLDQSHALFELDLDLAGAFWAASVYPIPATSNPGRPSPGVSSPDHGGQE